MVYALRTSGDPLRYVNAVREIVRRADARVPVSEVRTQAADIDQTINQEITFAELCSGFAMLALVIACVGLYGTVSYNVARRTGEIGIRMALGAQRGVVVRMVLREVLVLAAVGLAIGVALALGHVEIGGIVSVRNEAQRSAGARGSGGDSAGRRASGRLCTGEEGIADRSDGRAALRITDAATSVVYNGARCGVF